MPTYEVLLAVMLLFVVRGLTSLDRIVGGLVAGVVAAGCLYAIFAWGLYFGGPALLLGATLGFAWGWTSRRKTCPDPADRRYIS